jgi:excisionase family DNA binding protein
VEEATAMVDGYMSPTEAAAALGMSLTGIHARLRSGQMAGERIGARGWLIPRAEVERWREQGKLKPGPKPGQRRERRGEGAASV